MQLLVLYLTILRILAAPIIFICAIFLENYALTFWLFTLAALTDFLDGKLARYFQVETKLGAILDPIGDKLLLLFAIITIIILSQDLYVAMMGAFILGREFWVSALREISSFSANASLTAVTYIAKLKTAFQFLAISMFFLGSATGIVLISFLAKFVLLISALLSLKSAIDYTQKTLSVLNRL